MMLDLLVLPACILTEDSITAVNSAFIEALDFQQPLPMPFASLLDKASSALLRQYQIEIQAGTRQKAILQLRFINEHGGLWLGFGGLQAVDDASKDAYLLVLQEDYATQAYDALQEYIMQTPDFVMVADVPTQSIIYSNQQTFLGYGIKDIINSAWLLDYVHPDDLQRVRVFREQINRRYHRQTSIEYRVLVKAEPDQSQHYEWIESRENALQVTEDGDCLRLLYHLRRITERKRYEHAISQRNRTLTVIQEISRIINQSLDLRIILAELLDHIQVLIPFTSASIFSVNGDKMELLTQANLPPSVVASLQTDDVIAGTLTRHILDSYKPHIVPDTYLEPEWYLLDETEYIRSWMGVPLLYHHNEIIGIINFDHETPGFYTQEHFGNASHVASHIALAVYNSRLYERAQLELAERQQAEEALRATLTRTDAMYQSGRLMMNSGDLKTILTEVLEQLRQALQADTIVFVTFDLMNGEVQYALAQPFKSESRVWMDFNRVVDGRADPRPFMPEKDLPFEHGICMALSDGRYAVATSIHQRGALIAMRHDRAFKPDDAGFITALAGQLSVAIDRDELNNRLQQYTQHLELMVTRATESLQLERQRSQAILDATGEGIIYMENYVIQYANPAICRMLGYTAAELVGIDFKSLRHKGGMIRTADGVFFDATETQPTRRDEYPLIRKDGDLFPASLTFSMIGRLGESPLRMVAVVRDITLDRELSQQRMRFISNAAHELRTPLTSFHLRLHMARRQPERIKEHLDNLEQVYEYLKLLVEELLDLSRFEKGTIDLSYGVIDVVALIRNVIQQLEGYAEQSQVTFEQDLPDILRAEIDAERVERVIFILLTNGINYSEAGGKVSVTMKALEHEGIHYAKITFKDDGVGIDPELLPEQIFTPFSRPRLGMRHETGMGLAIAREIIRLHSGRIAAESIKGQGSTFTVLLPLIPPSLIITDNLEVR